MVNSRQLFTEFEDLLRSNYGCMLRGIRSQQTLHMHRLDQDPTVECDLEFVSAEMFEKLLRVLYNNAQEEKLIENNSAVKRAYEDFKILVALANGDENGN